MDALSTIDPRALAAKLAFASATFAERGCEANELTVGAAPTLVAGSLIPPSSSRGTRGAAGARAARRHEGRGLTQFTTSCHPSRNVRRLPIVCNARGAAPAIDMDERRGTQHDCTRRRGRGPRPRAAVDVTRFRFSCALQHRASDWYERYISDLYAVQYAVVITNRSGRRGPRPRAAAGRLPAARRRPS